MATNQHSNDAYYRVDRPQPHVYIQMGNKAAPQHLVFARVGAPSLTRVSGLAADGLVHLGARRGG